MRSVRASTRRAVSRAVAVVCLTASLLGGCTAPGASDVEAGHPSTGSVSDRFSEDVPYATERLLDIHSPPPNGLTSPAAVPVVVLLHGCCGDRSDLGKLSEAIAAARLLVFNVDWAGMDADATFPANYEDVACAIRFARVHARDFGGDPDRIILAGWSDGAMAAAAVAAAGSTFEGPTCIEPEGSTAPVAVVGIGGFYGWPLPVPDTFVTPRTIRLFGGEPKAIPQNWAAATPFSWLASAPSTLLLVGATDPLRVDARRYADALHRAGRWARVVEIPPDGDQSLISPRTSEGRRVVSEIAAIARTWKPTPGAGDAAPTSR
jgi:acetyl esterase/lipase